MSALNPQQTTARDLCVEAMVECGAIGVGQTPLAENIVRAQTRLQWMLQEWETRRLLVFHLVTLSKVSTGASSYTLGPGGDIDISAASPFSSQFGPQFGGGVLTQRPDLIESAFVRQLITGNTNQPDYPLEIIRAREDYNQITLKSLQTLPQCLFYDSDWPLGRLYPWPIPPSGLYELHVSIRAQLPVAFSSSAVNINLPYKYYQAIMSNLAMKLRPSFGIGTYPGDQLPIQAAASLNLLKQSNVQIGRLQMPRALSRRRSYNIFSDQA